MEVPQRVPVTALPLIHSFQFIPSFFFPQHDQAVPHESNSRHSSTADFVDVSSLHTLAGPPEDEAPCARILVVIAEPAHKTMEARIANLSMGIALSVEDCFVFIRRTLPPRHGILVGTLLVTVFNRIIGDSAPLARSSATVPVLEPEWVPAFPSPSDTGFASDPPPDGVAVGTTRD